MPENIRKARNTAIIISCFELFCCFSSSLFYEQRRSKIILMLVFMSFVATAGGFYAKLLLSYNGLVCHSIFAISFIGGFYIYIMVDYALSESNDTNLSNDSKSLPLS
jgi:zinc transporter ZupT